MKLYAVHTVVQSGIVQSPNVISKSWLLGFLEGFSLNSFVSIMDIVNRASGNIFFVALKKPSAVNFIDLLSLIYY